MRGTGPLQESRNVVAEGGVVYLIDQDSEEGGGLVVRIRLELGADLDDEGGSYGGKQTGLQRGSTHVCLNDGHNVRILGSCSNPRRASSENPYHIPQPPCGNVRRIRPEDPPVMTSGPLSFYTSD